MTNSLHFSIYVTLITIYIMLRKEKNTFLAIPDRHVFVLLFVPNNFADGILVFSVSIAEGAWKKKGASRLSEFGKGQISIHESLLFLLLG